MSIMNFIKSELQGWGRVERVVFPLVILLVIVISFVTGDNKVALVSAVCGISYTILAGKGKISCYYIGLIGTICYAYLSYRNAFWGNLALYAGYYFPMQINGIFQWRKNLNSDTKEVVKTCLSNKERVIYFAGMIALTLALRALLIHLKAAAPLMDAVTTVFSVFGLLLTVKRCLEQWVIWFFVNGVSTVMWLFAYLNGSNCLATVLMWATYFVVGIYFFFTWKKEINHKA